MKKNIPNVYLLLIAVIIINVISIEQTLWGQDFSVWSHIRNSAYTNDNTIHIRCELMPMIDSRTTFHYFQDTVWNSSELSYFNGETYETIIPVNPQQTVYGRYRTEMLNDFFDFSDILPGAPDSLVIMMPGYFPELTFPPNPEMLAKVADAPTNEEQENYLPYLDITGHYVSFTDTDIHTAITNNHTSFPTGPIIGPYNMYTTLLINPETVMADTVFYGIIYANVIGLFTPGLYRFSSFDLLGISRIGAVSHSAAGNTLFLSCSLEDLTSDPYFGDWPGFSNSLIFVPVTLRIQLVNMQPEFIISDVGPLSIQIFNKYFLEPFENDLPTLSNLRIQQLPGYINVLVDYFDANGNFPLYSKLIPDGHPSFIFNPLSFDYGNTVTFITGFRETEFNGIIRFSDNGTDMVELPINLNIEDDTKPEYKPLIRVYPNPIILNGQKQSVNINIDNQITSQVSDISIFNIRGQLVRRFSNDSNHTQLIWDCNDDTGLPVGTGNYFIKLKTPHQIITEKLMIVK